MKKIEDNLLKESFSTTDLKNETIFANISLEEELRTKYERELAELKRKEILSKHKPSIKQLPSGSWYTRLNGKKIEKRNLKDLEDVIIAAYKSSPNTFSSIFNAFLERRKMEVSDNTWSKDKRYYDTLIKGSTLDTIPLEDISLDDGYAFINHCLKKKPNMKKKYWNNVLGTINQIFKYAIEKKYINSNPFENLKPKNDIFCPPTKTRDGDTVFTRNEQEAVCSLAEKEAIETNNAIPLGIIILFNLGLRDGELCALKWKDIENNNDSLYLHVQRELIASVDESTGKARGCNIVEHCKTQAGDRRLQLNQKAIVIFGMIKKLNLNNNLPVGDEDFIFLRNIKNEIQFCTPRCFDPRLRRYCKKAGMKIIKSPHDIRRTVITNLYSVHMPIKQLQYYAGHSTPQQTMDYIRIKDDDLSILNYLETL